MAGRKFNCNGENFELADSEYADDVASIFES